MLKRVESTLILLLLTYGSLSLQAIAQSTQESAQTANDPVISQAEGSPLTQLGTEYHNGIKLLQNRFRIDYEVDEITMIFFREFGSASIVLVQPDGTKIYQASADGESVFWFDTATYDMISIKNPIPGPWQAVGQITPESRVMVISGLALHAEPLPAIIFSGEILKQTAYLSNNGIPIDYSAFRDVVELTISFSSTNNPNYNNFGANAEIVAFFEDNGKGMDERPLDGTFTGQFNLAIADGEWIPTFSVSTPMFTREQVDPNIMLLANPVKVEVEVDEGDGGYHKLKVDAQREYVDMSTLLIDGKVRFPNGDIQNFSITDMSADVREYLIVNFGYGVYRVKLTAYGNTIEGREFILDVPEYSFLTEEPKPIATSNETDGSNGSNLEGTTKQNTLSGNQDSAKQPQMSTTMLVSLIVGINLFILIVGGGLIWWLTSNRKNASKLSNKSEQQSQSKTQSKESIDEKIDEKKAGFFARLFKRKPKEASKEQAKEPSKEKAEEPTKENKPQKKEQSDSDFMDLDTPKE